MSRLSIVIPALNEARVIERTLSALAPMRARGTELIVADGGSTDGTPNIAVRLADEVIESASGRALQMNAGAAQASGDILLFLHADTELPQNADALVVESLARSGKRWGRIDVSISGAHLLFPVIAWMMNWRSRLTGIATGDQAIFVTRELFERAGGYPSIRLMEDVAFARTLKRHGAPLALTARVSTSGRRWETHGVLRTVWLMWRLRFAYWRGADPDELVLHYVPHKH
ncbi:MAG: TIGR04283 family arsenosugar biosynthesis glycosyltransferase [Burkholderiales bacterium]